MQAFHRCLPIVLWLSLYSGVSQSWFAAAQSTRLDFTFFPDQVTWQQSRHLCKAGGGTLATVNSEREQLALGAMMSAQGSAVLADQYGFHAAWIGLTDKEQEGTWRWAGEEGAPQYSAWGGREPNSFGDEDCAVALDLYGWRWADYGCENHEGFVCRGLQDPEAVRSALHQAQGKAEELQEQMQLALFTNAVTYKDAVKACAAGGGVLAGIHLEEEQQVLTKLLIQEQDSIPINSYQQTSVWIGYSDGAQEGRWKWEDKSASDYTTWGDGEPNSFGDEDCAVATNVFAWKWADYACSQEAAFLCRGAHDEAAVRRTAAQAAEDARMAQIRAAANADYTFVPQPASWRVAMGACRAAGGVLAGVHSAEQQSAIVALMREHADELEPNSFGQQAAWLGFTDRKQEGNWNWLDDSQDSFTAWGGNEPQNWGDEDCGATMKVWQWQWGDYSCDIENPFVCQGLGDPVHGVKVATDFVLNGGKEDRRSDKDKRGSWDKSNRKWRWDKASKASDLDENSVHTLGKYSLIVDTVSWSEAVGSCARLGGRIAGVHSEEDQSVLAELLSKYVDDVEVNDWGQRSAWIGFCDIRREGNWEWKDGGDSTFTAWGGDEPNSYGDEDCAVAIDIFEWKWADYACEALQTYVCQDITSLPSNEDDSETKTPSTSGTSSEQSGDGEHKGGGHDGSYAIAVFAAVMASLAVLLSGIAVAFQVRKWLARRSSAAAGFQELSDGEGFLDPI